MFFIGLIFLLYLGLLAYPNVAKHIVLFTLKCYIFLHPQPTLSRVLKIKRILQRLSNVHT